MTLQEFHPHNATGENPCDLFYKSHICSPKGAHFELFKEKHHTNKDVERAKKYLHNHFDVLSIRIIKES